ncbi:MAG: hypothetical protein M1427_06555 [Candidatus Thermoplasmatota archaeon]|jgi:hypothetical protein|nr:hypothetical protein [Candidatus Thermoplasmatota archaeon]
MSYEEGHLRKIPVKWAYRRSFLGFPNYRVIGVIYVIGLYMLLIRLTFLIPPAQFAIAVELLFAIIGLMVMVSKIIKSEKEIKKFTGHYYLFPPQDIYE